MPGLGAEGPAAWWSRFRDAGFEAIGGCTGSRGPSVAEAFREVVHIDAEPVERMGRRAADAAQRVGEAWKARAAGGGVLSDDGSFLAAGGMAHGWLRVRLTDDVDIAALADPPGELLQCGDGELM